MSTRSFKPVKIGSSYYICIPKKLVEALDVKEGRFRISVKGNQLIYEKVKEIPREQIMLDL